MSEKISVIIPVYNSEKYIGRAIESVLRQTYEDLELIIVDDGSTDTTSDICLKYTEQDNRTKYFIQSNSGPSKARELGLSKATGMYVFFLDSDDYLEKECLKTLFLNINEHQADIVQSSYAMVDSLGKEIKKVQYSFQIVCGSDECSSFFAAKKNTNNFLWGRLYKKSLFEEIEFGNFYYSEDYYILTQLYYHASKAITLEKILYDYVQTENSLCRMSFNIKRLDALKVGEIVYKFYHENTGDLRLCGQAASYICSNAVRLYINAEQSQVNKDLLNKIKNTFRKYYKKSKTAIYESKKRKTMLFLFSVSPKSCLYLAKIFNICV